MESSIQLKIRQIVAQHWAVMCIECVKPRRRERKLLPTHSAANEKIWLVGFVCDKIEVCPITLRFFFKGPALSKHFLRPIFQMYMWNRSIGHGNHSIWQIWRRIFSLSILVFNFQSYIFQVQYSSRTSQCGEAFTPPFFCEECSDTFEVTF